MKKIISIIIFVAVLSSIYFLIFKSKSQTDEIPTWDSTLINHSKIPDSI